MNLFKLIKDGKCVGHEETFFYPDGAYAIGHKKQGRAAFVKIIQVDPDGVAITNMRKFIIHDAKHRYVTTDKNGEKVFEGDKVSLFSKPFMVVWNERELGYYLKDTYAAQINLSHVNIRNIELIKDTEDLKAYLKPRQE